MIRWLGILRLSKAATRQQKQGCKQPLHLFHEKSPDWNCGTWFQVSRALQTERIVIPATSADSVAHSPVRPQARPQTTGMPSEFRPGWPARPKVRCLSPSPPEAPTGTRIAPVPAEMEETWFVPQHSDRPEFQSTRFHW